MHKRSILAPASAAAAMCLILVSPGLALPQQEETPEVDQFVGSYEVYVEEMGTLTITVRKDEETGDLFIAGGEQPETKMTHVEDNRYEIDTDLYGTILIEFLYNDEGDVDSMALDSYEFSLLATKVGS